MSDKRSDIARKHETPHGTEQNEHGQSELNPLDLLAAHRTAVVRAVVRHLSHETVQPLTALMNYVEVGMTEAEHAAPRNENFRFLMERIQRHAEEAEGCLRGLRRRLDASPGLHEPFDANHVVCEAAEFMASEARQRGITVHVHPAPVLPRARGDRYQLLQALVEVIRNSFEAIGEASNAPCEVRMYTASSENEALEIRVQDAAKALSPQETERIFKPFYTTKHGRLGLGLPAARAAVEAHGGDILARSDADLGMTFLLRIPTGEIL